MSHNFNKVAVLLGGDSAEREISLKSGQAILDALQRQHIAAQGLDPKEYNLFALKDDGFDCAFIALHGAYGENGTIQAVLEYLNIPYTGSRMAACALAMDKYISKEIWKGAQIPVCNGRRVYASQLNDLETTTLFTQLGPSLIIKPNSGGSSCGISIIDDPAQLLSALQHAFEYEETALIESYIQGSEYSVPIIANQAYPSVRLQTERAFYDYTAKYLDQKTQYFCPSGLDKDEEEYIAQLSLNAFNALGCQSWGRADWIRDPNGQWFLLEMNTTPGMTQTSLVPKSADATGVDFDTLILKILAQAC